MKPGLVFLGVLVAVVVASSTTVTVRALGDASWTSAPPTVTQTATVAGATGNTCAGFLQDMAIAELSSTYKVCANGDDGLKIGYFSSGGPYRGAVAFPYSNGAHLLEGVCGGVICRYSADTDILVTQQSVGQYGVGVVVYKHASDRIHRVQSDGVTKYVFDANHPDYAVKNDAGRYLWTPSFGVSENGQWLVLELRDAGIAVVDMNSFSERHIVMNGYRYGYGMDPFEELAVSNDGKSVAVMGMNAGFSVIDVTDGCGQALVGDLQKLAATVQCPYTYLSIGTLFPNFHYAEQPRFYGNGQQLEVVVNSWVDGSKRVTFLRSGATAVHKLKLLALGDSFTSGEGETDASFYRPGTDEHFDTCHVSLRSYPFLIALRTGVTSDDVRSVACAGAKISDIIGSKDGYWGQAHRLGVGGLKLSPADKTVAQEAALNNFQPGRALQSSFLERYNPEAIIVGVGGNDAGLMGKLKVCAMPGTCEWAYGEGLRATANEIKRLYGTLGTLYAYISQHNPGARVYVVGYPDSIDAEGTCDAATGFLLDHSERVFVAKSVAYLNQIISAAARRAGFTYLDIEHSFDGSKLCSGSAINAMNGLRLGDDISIISFLPMLKIISSGTFHPTPIGHSLIADAILSGHPGLRQDAACTSDPAACSAALSVAEPSPYWGTQLGVADRLSYAADFAFPVSGDGRHLNFEVGAGTFEGGTSVTMTIQSAPISLGSFIVDGTGGVTGAITIPPDVEDGYHTLHLTGTNREGITIDVYQFVTIGSAGEVVSVGVGDGAATAEPTPTIALPQAHSLSIAPSLPNATLNSTGVLGAQTTPDNRKGVKADALDTIRHIEGVAKTNKSLVIAVTGLGLLVLLTICVFLLWRRWVKPGS
ncbi:MAG TPA: SGNH/GDSL hydrolase family protein [Candidatus Microsaccharimonas sp.]|jgi:hypothetical protein